METKILQIIPAPDGLLAHYSGIGGEKEFHEQAVCMALVEVDDGRNDKYREVRAMVCGNKDDFIEFPDEAANFIGLCFVQNPPAPIADAAINSAE